MLPNIALNVVGHVLAANPGISPNGSGLPGLGEVRRIVGALLTWGLVACVAGLVISAMVWAVSSNAGNYHGTSKGKTGVLVSAVAALLIGGANAIIGFFAAAGQRI
jgi:hypothetical protein